MHNDNASPQDPRETRPPTPERPGRGQAATTWRRLGRLLFAGGCGGLVAGLAVLLLFRGLYALSFALAGAIDGWQAFAVFGLAVVFSIFLSGFLAGLAGAVVSGLLLSRLWPFSWRRLLLWATMWLGGSTGLSLAVLGRHVDPAIGVAAAGWWLLLGILLALLFDLPALLRRRASA
jgi:hypothetical protein